MEMSNMKDAVMEVEEEVSSDDIVLKEGDITQEYELGEAPIDSDEEGDSIDQMPTEETEEHDFIDNSTLVYKKHTGPIYSASISSQDQKLLVTGSGDDTAIVWSLETGEIIFELNGHTDTVSCVGFSRDGLLIATGGYDGIVKIWSTKTGKLERNLEGPSMEIEWLSWHSKGNVVLAGSADGTAWMWLATTGSCMSVFAGHEDSVTCGMFTSSGKMAVTGSADGTVRLWNPKTGACNHVFKGNDFHDGPICALACHPTDPLILSGSQDGTARVLHLKSKKVLAVIEHGTSESKRGTIEDEGMNTETTTNSVECVAFSPSVNWCASGCLEGELRIWDLSNHKCRHVCRQSQGIIRVEWHPTQPIVFTASVDGVLRMWDARNGECMREFHGHQDMILDMTIAMENETLAVITASDDQTARKFCI